MARSRAETRGPMVDALKRLGLDSRARICDAGMGAGCLGECIRAAFPDCELTGVDYWLRFLVDPDCRKTEGWPSLSLYNTLIGGGDGELSRFMHRTSAGSYDAIVFGDVLEHMPQAQAFDVLRRALEVATRGVVINIPVSDFPQMPVWDNEGERHLWWWTRGQWEDFGAEWIGGDGQVATFLFRADVPAAPILSIVIPAFNRRRFLDLSLRSILRTEAPAWRFEIIVVDDGSIDGTAEHIRREFGDWGVSCIRRTKNVGKPNGPGLARNVGLRAARGDWVAFADSDVVHCNDVISATLTALDKPGIYRCHGHWVLETQAVGGEPEKGSCFRANEEHGSTAPAQMWWVAPRKVLMDIGGYDERFAVYGAEDLDIYARLGRCGLKIVKIPGQFAVGLYAKRNAGAKDVIDVKQNELQHALWREDETMVRNVGVDWGQPHDK